MSLEGSLPALYSPRGRVTSRLDLGDNRKVITDYRNHGIIRIIIDLVVSSGYLPGVLREMPSSVVPARLHLVGWATPRGTTHVFCRGYLGSYTPQLVPECLVPVVQSRLELVRAGANNTEQSSSWSNHHAELPSSVNRCRAA